MDPPWGDPDRIDAGEVVAGRYRLDRSLGASRMSEVFAATDLRLGRRVAVKRLPPSGARDATAEARFAREARALARVNDPNVVTVFDIVVERGRPLLVMELVEGTTLRHLLDREGPLDAGRAVPIGVGICSGLEAVHARGIVHRDLKPSNVFLTPSGTVKIGDFGIARVADDVTVTRTGEVFGSAPYVAPEQVSGDPVDARADLYALGCVLFEMTTGRPPFEGGDPASLAYRHVHATPERADAVDPTVPNALASIIERLLAKDPADRSASASEVRRSLEGLPAVAAPAGDEAPTEPLPPASATDRLPALPPPPPRRPTSWIPWAAVLALGIVLLLVLNALTAASGSNDPAQGPAPRPSASGSASPPPSPRSPNPTPTPATTGDPLNALLALVDQLGSTGAVDDHLARDLDHHTDELQRALDEGDGRKADDALHHLQDAVDKGLDHGEISPEDAARLDQAILLVATTVDGDEDQDEDG
jgi:serine/threonine-protein kinase